MALLLSYILANYLNTSPNNSDILQMNKLLEYYKGTKKKVLVIARRHVVKLMEKQNLVAKARFFYVNDM